MFTHLNHKDSFFPGCAIVVPDDLNDPRHGYGIPDHGCLRHARLYGNRKEGTPDFFLLQIVTVNRIRVLRLDAYNFRKPVDHTGFMEFQKTSHDRRDVPCIPYGQDHHFVSHIIVKILGHFIGKGFLPQNTPAVLGIQERYRVFLCKRLHDLHTIVKYPGNLQHKRAAAQGLGQLLWRHFSLGEENSGPQKPFQIGPIQRGGSGCVSCRGANGQQILYALFLGKVVDVAQGACHSPVLEGGAGIQAIVFEIKIKTHHRLQPVIRLHQGRMTLPEVNNPI